MSHTPGPWNVVTHNWHETSVYGADDARVCKLDTEDWGVDEETEDEFGREQGANARLIAAAPDLLAALVRLVRLADSFSVSGVYFHEGKNQEAIDFAYDAIGKAEGSL